MLDLGNIFDTTLLILVTILFVWWHLIRFDILANYSRDSSRLLILLFYYSLWFCSLLFQLWSFITVKKPTEYPLTLINPFSGANFLNNLVCLLIAIFCFNSEYKDSLYTFMSILFYWIIFPTMKLIEFTCYYHIFRLWMGVLLNYSFLLLSGY